MKKHRKEKLAVGMALAVWGLVGSAWGFPTWMGVYGSGPKSFSARSIANAIADLQSGQFTLELWDWPSADYAGANIAKLGEPFTVEWEW